MKPLLVSVLLIVASCAVAVRHPSAISVLVDPEIETSLQPGSGAVDGVVIDANTNEPLAGVTIMLTPGAGSADSAVTDEHGAFRITTRAGHELLTAYYIETQFERHLAVRSGGLLHVKIGLEVVERGNERIL